MTIEKLNQLAEFYAQRDALMLAKQAEVEKIYTPEIRQAVADIEVEFAQKAEAVTANIAALEAEVKDAVLAAGKSVKGEYLQAVWSKPRVSWDTKTLDGLMIAIPQLAQARKEGAPSVSIRKV
jgi:hypothetical protein